MARPNLDHLLLQDIQAGDVELGAGAYGRVFEVEYAGLACAAKEIHPIFFRVARREKLERTSRRIFFTSVKYGAHFATQTSYSLLVPTILLGTSRAAHRGGGGGGGELGHFSPGPSLKGTPGGPMKGPLNTCLKDRYTLIEQSQYSSEEQCSKLIDKEIW